MYPHTQVVNRFHCMLYVSLLIFFQCLPTIGTKNKIVIIKSCPEDFKKTLIMLKLNSTINQSVNNAMWLRTFSGEIQIKSSEAINFHKADNNKSTTVKKLLIYLLSIKRVYLLRNIV